MQEYDELGELIDLFVMIAWTGIRSSGDEGYEAVPSLPAKKAYHSGGMDLKCERVHNRLDIIGSKISRIYQEELRWLERNVGTN